MDFVTFARVLVDRVFGKNHRWIDSIKTDYLFQETFEYSRSIAFPAYNGVGYTDSKGYSRVSVAAISGIRGMWGVVVSQVYYCEGGVNVLGRESSAEASVRLESGMQYVPDFSSESLDGLRNTIENVFIPESAMAESFQLEPEVELIATLRKLQGLSDGLGHIWPDYLPDYITYGFDRDRNLEILVDGGFALKVIGAAGKENKVICDLNGELVFLHDIPSYYFEVLHEISEAVKNEVA